MSVIPRSEVRKWNMVIVVRALHGPKVDGEFKVLARTKREATKLAKQAYLEQRARRMEI